ncbi:hypothetical protein QBC44DRAFT_359569 [Cladorrhinum sp. PSN332]|nr:hypothetical protein QBC44DRAFT_359569 [Cladorrhinum sp. PSN332]
MAKLNLLGLALGLFQVASGLAVGQAGKAAPDVAAYGPRKNVPVVALVDLGQAVSYAAVSRDSISGSGSLSVLKGNVAVASPGTSIYGFPPNKIFGTKDDPGSPRAVIAYNAASLAYTNAASRPNGIPISGTIGAGTMFPPGVYRWTNGGVAGLNAYLDGALILDGQNNPKSVFIFQIPANLFVGTYTQVTVALKNKASACNVFWQVEGYVYLGYQTLFAGNILANGYITASYATKVEGGLYSVTSGITLYDATVSREGCDKPKEKPKWGHDDDGDDDDEKDEWKKGHEGKNDEEED